MKSGAWKAEKEVKGWLNSGS